MLELYSVNITHHMNDFKVDIFPFVIIYKLISRYFGEQILSKNYLFCLINFKEVFHLLIHKTKK